MNLENATCFIQAPHGTGAGTGWFINRRVVVTAAHVVPLPLPGYSVKIGGRTYSGTATAFDAYDNNTEARNDIGCVILDEQSDAAIPLLDVISADALPTLEGKACSIRGFDAHGASLSRPGKIFTLTRDRILYEATADERSLSGAAVWIDDLNAAAGINAVFNPSGAILSGDGGKTYTGQMNISLGTLLANQNLAWLQGVLGSV